MKPQLEQLESRLVPSTVTYHGGDNHAPIANPEITNVYVGNVANEDALAQVLATQYGPLLAPYGVGSGRVVSDQAVADPGTITNAWLGQQVQNLAAARQIPLDPNSLVMFYLPRIVSDPSLQNSAAYHSAAFAGGQWIPYTVVWTQPGLTVGASHEFAEAATDPYPGTGWFGGSLGEEIADLGGGNTFSLGGFNVAVFALPDGSLYAGGGTPAPPPTTNPPVNVYPVFQHYLDGILGIDNFIAAIEQDIAGLVSLWQSWEAQVLSWEASLWSGLHITGFAQKA